MLVLLTGPKKPKHPEMALKSETMGSYGRNAGEHRLRPLPNRAASARAPTVFQPRLSVRGRDPHDCSDASYVGGCNDGRPGLGTDRPRLRVRGDRGPDRRPSLDGAHGDGQNIQPGLSEIVCHDHRPKARKVEGGARQRRRRYVSMLRTQVRPIAPAKWAARPPTAVLAYLACMGTDLGL